MKEYNVSFSSNEASINNEIIISISIKSDDEDDATKRAEKIFDRKSISTEIVTYF